MVTHRGKHIETGEWVYGYRIGEDVIVGEIVEFHDEYFNTEFWCRVDPETIGRNTEINPFGSEKEVYEDDVVDYDDGQCIPFDRTHRMRGVVQMLEGCWMIVDDANEQAVHLWNETAEIKIVGNIYDNPELMQMRYRVEVEGEINEMITRDEVIDDVQNRTSFEVDAQDMSVWLIDMSVGQTVEMRDDCKITRIG